MAERYTHLAPKPSIGRWLWAVTVGLLAFLASWFVGVAVVVLIIRLIPPDVPHPTEAYEGIGDYYRAMFLFYLGTGLSFLVAVVVGVAVSMWVAYRGVNNKRAEAGSIAIR